MFLDIFRRPVYISKCNVSETGFCLRLQGKPAQLGPIDRVSPYFRIIFGQLIMNNDKIRKKSTTTFGFMEPTLKGPPFFYFESGIFVFTRHQLINFQKPNMTKIAQSA
jgi:hypothetical protein